jgi:large subunit ribosomal protein L25
LAVDEKNPITVSIPVTVEGNSPGVRAGGKLIQKIQRLKIKGLIKDIPDSIVINIDGLDLGQSTKVKNVEVPNIQILDNKDNAIVSIKMTRNVIKEEVAAKK